MRDIKRGQKVWVLLRGEVKETIVKSVGYKYITLEFDSEILFDRRTLKRANYKKDFIILDIEKYMQDREQLINNIKNFKWEKVNIEDLNRINDILKKSCVNE